MKYVQPILYVCGNNEVSFLNYIKAQYRHDFDILAPYDYQRKHISLLRGYVAPEYYKMCPAEDSQSETLKTIDGSPYADYFIYFLICFLKEETHYNRTRFLMWLHKRHELYMRERSFDVLKYYELKRYYQTIVVDLELDNGNFWNRIWGMAPNVYNKKAISKISDHLLEEGNIIFLNMKGNWKKVWDYVENGFTEVESNCFMKNKTIKKEYKTPRNWL
jgi:hypothetical protein